MAAEDHIAFYDYVLPPELIASQPAAARDDSRLLVVHRLTGEVEHRQFRDFPQLLMPGDLLVMNNTRVVPARLQGVRTQTGGRWEGLFLREDFQGEWRVIGQTRGRLQPGETVTIPAREAGGPPLVLSLIDRDSQGEWRCQPNFPVPATELLESYGSLPLPHYMQRDEQPADRQRYQTVYAHQAGAVAAPTAGLHFTPELLNRCRARGVETAEVTLHVGLGTFRPVSADHLADHVMHHEWRNIPQETVEMIVAAKQRGCRVVAVGTTTVRSLESAALEGTLSSGAGETNLFIRPPFEFRVTDALLTNFHLPKSTLLVLVSTFAGRELILRAYEEAITQRYRFFSYGDAMLIV